MDTNGFDGTRVLGRSGIKVSALGMGCWAIGGPWTFLDENSPAGWGEVDDAESIRAIHHAVDLGITFFDTAANYGAGRSERVLGQAIAGRRDKVVVATKFGHIIDEQKRTMRKDNAAILGNVRKDLENSLRRLNTDTIDLYQLHEEDYDPDQALVLRGVLEDFVKEGKIRAYGWSTDDAERARIFATGQNCASIQHYLNILMDHPAALAVCEQNGVASINKTPLLMGVLTGKFTPGVTFGKDDVRSWWNNEPERLEKRVETVARLREVLTAGGRTLAQGALGWIWARSKITIPIPGFRNEKQVEENAGALAFGPLSSQQMAEINQILEPAIS
jgi:aryl-alcohol dehydrogenase-like predicted oxidoreductase